MKKVMRDPTHRHGGDWGMKKVMKVTAPVVHYSVVQSTVYTLFQYSSPLFTHYFSSPVHCLHTQNCHNSLHTITQKSQFALESRATISFSLIEHTRGNYVCLSPKTQSICTYALKSTHGKNMENSATPQ